MAPPAFLGVGMPKCGTSTLHRVLSQHSAFFLPPVKEIKYFAYDEIDYHGAWQEFIAKEHWAAKQEWKYVRRWLQDVIVGQQSISSLGWIARYFIPTRDYSWYISLFREDRIGGDISPIYHTLSKDRIKEIHQLLPDTKIIILLRSPLQQIWSHCRMVVLRLNKSDAEDHFRDHVEKTTEMRQTYVGLVEDWRTYFGDQVHVGYMEELNSKPISFFQKITDFLGAADDPVWQKSQESITKAKVNVGLNKEVPDSVRDVLIEHAAIRLAGYEAIDAAVSAQWQQDLDRFRNSGAMEN